MEIGWIGKCFENYWTSAFLEENLMQAHYYTLAEFQSQLWNESTPQVIVFDVCSLAAGFREIEAVAQNCRNKCRFVLLGSPYGLAAAGYAVRIGIFGHLPCHDNQGELEKAIRAASCCALWYSSDLISPGLQKTHQPIHAVLSPREQQVAGLITSGASNLHIASELGITVNTVKSHVKRIMRKSKVTTRAQFAVLGIADIAS